MVNREHDVCGRLGVRSTPGNDFVVPAAGRKDRRLDRHAPVDESEDPEEEVVRSVDGNNLPHLALLEPARRSEGNHSAHAVTNEDYVLAGIILGDDFISIRPHFPDLPEVVRATFRTECCTWKLFLKRRPEVFPHRVHTVGILDPNKPDDLHDLPQS